MRTRKWKYARFPKKIPVYEQLFDLSKDPNELKDLSRDDDHEAMLRRLRHRCDVYRREFV